MDVQRKNIGLNFYQGRWELRVWAPMVARVQFKPESGGRLFDLIPQDHG